MSYVDLMSDLRWSEADHVDRVESTVRSATTHTREHVLIRRSIAFVFYLLAQTLPDGAQKTLLMQFGRPLTDSALAELMAAAAVFDVADALAVQARADAALLGHALDYEQARAQVAALADQPYPDRKSFPSTTAGTSAYLDACAAVDAANAATATARATARVAPQAVMSAATQQTLDLVALRDAHRSPGGVA